VLGGRVGALITGSVVVVGGEVGGVVSEVVEVICSVWATVVMVAASVEVVTIEVADNSSGAESFWAQPTTRNPLIQKSQVKRIPET